MCPVMSWVLCLCLWVSVTAIQLCQATFYDTIQQHHGTRPGRTTIHMIGESCTAFAPSDDSKVNLQWNSVVSAVCVYWDCHRLRGHTTRSLSCGFIFHCWFYNGTSINTLAAILWSKIELSFNQNVQWLFCVFYYNLALKACVCADDHTDHPCVPLHFCHAITADIDATLLPLHLLYAILLEEIARNRIWPKHCAGTSVFVRRMRTVVMVNNYDLSRGEEAERCQNFKGRSSCMSVQVFGVCYFLCTSGISARGLFNTFNIVSQTTSYSNTFISLRTSARVVEEGK